MSDRRSRCTVPRTAPLEWRQFVDEDHPDVREVEAWLSGLIPPVRRRMVAEFDALLEAAAEGALQFDPRADRDPNAPLIPVRRDPDLYELRLTMLAKRLRHYHAEPADEGDLLVALRFSHREWRLDAFAEWPGRLGWRGNA